MSKYRDTGTYLLLRSYARAIALFVMLTSVSVLFVVLMKSLTGEEQ